MKFRKINPKKFLILLLVCFFVMPVTAQNIEFHRSYFPDDRSGLREARRNIRDGDRLYEEGGIKKQEALEYYLKAQDFNPNNAWLNFKIGDSYLQTIQHQKAIPYLEKAVDLNVPTLEVYYLLGKAYQLNYKFDEAIAQYSFYRRQLTPQELIKKRETIDRRIAECQSGKALKGEPQRVFIDNLGAHLNSSYDDYAPLFAPDGRTMYFTSRRPIGRRPRTDSRDHKYFEKVLLAEKTTAGWRTLGEIPGRVNSRSHTAATAISEDGSLMVIYQGDRGGNLYESTLRKNGKWSKPGNISRTINSRERETSAAFSSDGNTMYFVSDRPGGYGGKDIWMTKRNERGRWTEPVNLGATVNTEYDEEGVFLAPDDKTLYFSSKGHNTMGGFDIFKTVFQNGRWTEPENLGYPINSPSDDLFFTLSADGNTGYFSSPRPEGYGGSDIYEVTFLGPEKPVINAPGDELIALQARPNPEAFLDDEVQAAVPMALLRGKIMDEETGEPLQAIIELYDNEEEVLLAEFTSNSETGMYFISLPGGKNYGISVQAEDYLFHSENINITESRAHREIINDIRLKKVEIGQSIVLKNIFFDTGQSTLRAESYAELGILYKLLTDNPTLKIEISGHTDNVGSAGLNKRLSEERARAVVDFLVERGIDKERLTYAGYGFEKPIASNETAEGRQMNRRTEFEIVEK